jgi:hypothetical protein
VVFVNGGCYNLRERRRVDTFCYWRFEFQRLQFDKHAWRRGRVVVLVGDYKVCGRDGLFLTVSEDVRLAFNSLLAPESSFLPKLRNFG